MRSRAWYWLLAAMLAAGAAVFALRRGSPPPAAPQAQQRPMAAGRAGETGTPAAGFLPALPGRKFSFPRDHASHPGYATEWWYYTGNLRDKTGRWYGYQLTFFRVGVTPPGEQRASRWAIHDLYFAHLAVTDQRGNAYQFRERIARGALGEADAQTDRYHVHIGDWSVRLEGEAHVLSASDNGAGVALRAVSLKPPSLNGDGGYSAKAAGRGRASYYYSLTRMETEGTLTIDGRTVQVSGLSWFDHEFGSNVLAENQVGWDWFSIQLDDGTDVMLYHMRTTDGGVDPFSSGTLVDATGKTTHLARDDFSINVLDTWKSPGSGAEYPARWRIRVPDRKVDLTLIPSVADQEIRAGGPAGVTYWEGSVIVKGTSEGAPVSGRGYAELTGYAARFQQSF